MEEEKRQSFELAKQAEEEDEYRVFLEDLLQQQMCKYCNFRVGLSDVFSSSDVLKEFYTIASRLQGELQKKKELEREIHFHRMLEKLLIETQRESISAKPEMASGVVAQNFVKVFKAMIKRISKQEKRIQRLQRPVEARPQFERKRDILARFLQSFTSLQNLKLDNLGNTCGLVSSFQPFGLLPLSNRQRRWDRKIKAHIDSA